jgi:rhodanese-related sulfurtransferase
MADVPVPALGRAARSSLAAATLHVLGLTRTTDLIGVFQAWRTAGLPVGRGG